MIAFAAAVVTLLSDIVIPPNISITEIEGLINRTSLTKFIVASCTLLMLVPLTLFKKRNTYGIGGRQQSQRYLSEHTFSSLIIILFLIIPRSNLFKSVWVPPFPNDAGSAIGAACCEMLTSTKMTELKWNVYSGPPVRETHSLINGYNSRPCNLRQVATLIHDLNEPVVFLNGDAEIGPRSLGNRSILASASNADMKSILNVIKNREDYRPVAPICLEDYASDIFEPGSPDPYMLFDHTVKESWKDRIPAVCHLDDTARLQTVREEDNRVIYDLLTFYKQLSGIPLLCNTSVMSNMD